MGPYRVGDDYEFVLTVSQESGPAFEQIGRAGSAPETSTEGTARFLIDGREVGRSPVRNLAGDFLSSSFSPPVPEPGEHAFTAEYLGTDDPAPCRVDDTGLISEAFSLVDLWAFPNNDRSDQVTVRLRSPYRFPTWPVRLYRGDRFVGSAELSVWNSATFKVDRQTGPATTLVVRYRGDREHEAVEHRVDLPRRVGTGVGLTSTSTVGDVYWTGRAVATVSVRGALPTRSTSAVVPVTPWAENDPTPQELACQRARWCHVTLDPRRGSHGFQGQQVLDPGKVLRRPGTRTVHRWY
jgi:hypothetical protein